MIEVAKQAATGMQATAEVEGNSLRVSESQQLLVRDIGPLSKEIEKQLNKQELFYQAPDIDSNNNNDLESLIQSSDSLLRESQSILADTEYVGNQTLLQMGQQREQLFNAQGNLSSLRGTVEQAKNILTSMSRRACRSKLALYVMIAFLASLDIWILVLIYKKHHPSSQSGGDENGDDDVVPP